ncbi:hypothetical protein AC249_AIPGENE1894 [Exaiptasia diaphana]|nr:hypothetical protein AC249_AIPGENE1894 [Exaiptasia diaphana]
MVARGHEINKVLVHNLVKHVQGLNMPPITVKNGFLSLSLSNFLLSALSNLAKRSFQPTVERKICDAVSKAISKKGKVLPTLYPETHLLAGLPCSMVSYPITKQPIVEQDYVDFLITLISASIQAVTVPTVQTTSNGSVLSFKAKTRAWIKSQGSSKMSMPLDRIDDRVTMEMDIQV